MSHLWSPFQLQFQPAGENRINHDYSSLETPDVTFNSGLIQAIDFDFVIDDSTAFYSSLGTFEREEHLPVSDLEHQSSGDFRQVLTGVNTSPCTSFPSEQHDQQEKSQQEHQVPQSRVDTDEISSHPSVSTPSSRKRKAEDFVSASVTTSELPSPPISPISASIQTLERQLEISNVEGIQGTDRMFLCSTPYHILRLPGPPSSEAEKSGNNDDMNRLRSCQSVDSESICRRQPTGTKELDNSRNGEALINLSRICCDMGIKGFLDSSLTSESPQCMATGGTQDTGYNMTGDSNSEKGLSDQAHLVTTPDHVLSSQHEVSDGRKRGVKRHHDQDDEDDLERYKRKAAAYERKYQSLKDINKRLNERLRRQAVDIDNIAREKVARSSRYVMEKLIQARVKLVDVNKRLRNLADAYEEAIIEGDQLHFMDNMARALYKKTKEDKLAAHERKIAYPKRHKEKAISVPDNSLTSPKTSISKESGSTDERHKKVIQMTDSFIDLQRLATRSTESSAPIVNTSGTKGDSQLSAKAQVLLFEKKAALVRKNTRKKAPEVERKRLRAR